jgi:N-acyl-D-aspartate/D-glutamate deacylase
MRAMPQIYDLVIRNGLVLDGSGAPGVPADVGVRGERIEAVGWIPERGGVEIDATGRAVSPGFIDVHSHDDWAVLVDPEFRCKTLQGVTTDIVGNCGAGVAPFTAGMMGGIGGADPATRGLAPWDGYAGYFARVDESGPSLNIAVLCGHGTARTHVMGREKREADATELAAMGEIVAEGMAAGCVGLSTGLIYEPGRYAATGEIVALARIAAEAGRLYASHMRDEASRLLDAVREAIHVGEAAALPVEISHHKVGGRSNWGRVRDSLRLIDEARGRGLDVTADQYPYTAGSTSLFAVVQNGFLGGAPEGGLGRGEAADVLIASCPDHREWEGKRLDAIALELDLPGLEAARRVIDVCRETFVIVDTMCEEDVQTVMRHPSTMIGSDGIAAGSSPHPRLWGTFPRVLGRYTRDLGVLDLPAAVHRMTGLPARKFGLTGRGAITPGSFADIVVFDPATIADVGTYDDPARPPVGIYAVVVNGSIVARDGAHTGARPGRALRAS